MVVKIQDSVSDVFGVSLYFSSPDLALIWQTVIIDFQKIKTIIQLIEQSVEQPNLIVLVKLGWRKISVGFFPEKGYMHFHRSTSQERYIAKKSLWRDFVKDFGNVFGLFAFVQWDFG
jgi:hypothetical protein